MIGRFILSALALTNQPVHDLYTIAVGLYACWLSIRLAMLAREWAHKGLSYMKMVCSLFIRLIFWSFLSNRLISNRCCNNPRPKSYSNNIFKSINVFKVNYITFKSHITHSPFHSCSTRPFYCCCALSPLHFHSSPSSLSSSAFTSKCLSLDPFV